MDIGSQIENNGYPVASEIIDTKLENFRILSLIFLNKDRSILIRILPCDHKKWMEAFKQADNKTK